MDRPGLPSQRRLHAGASVITSMANRVRAQRFVKMLLARKQAVETP